MFIWTLGAETYVFGENYFEQPLENIAVFSKIPHPLSFDYFWNGGQAERFHCWTQEFSNNSFISLIFFRWGISLFRVFPTHTSVFYRPATIKKKGKDFPRDIFSYWCLITRRNSARPRKVWFRNFIICATFCFFSSFSFFIYSSGIPLRSMM